MSEVLVNVVQGLVSRFGLESIVMPIAPNSRHCPPGSIAPLLSVRSGRIVAGRCSMAPLLSGRSGRIVAGRCDGPTPQRPFRPHRRGAPADLTLVACQLPVGHPVRPGGFGTEPFHLVLLVGAEVALEPKPFGLVVVVTFPGQDVRARSVEEPAVVRNHYRAAGKLL